nr:MAG TPA: hypothetical protein [Caudoviricetes sp.]
MPASQTYRSDGAPQGQRAQMDFDRRIKQNIT